MMRTRAHFFIILISVCVLQFVYYWPLMPEHMASHFDGAGNPNGWSSRRAFFCLYAGLTAMVILMFRILPSLLRRFPDSLVSVPNREYWLAAERRQEAFSLITDRLLFFGNGTLIFFVAIVQSVFQANLKNMHRMSAEAMWRLVIIYIIFTLAWTVNIVHRFKIILKRKA
jgi:uncharacterized membrane protein